MAGNAVGDIAGAVDRQRSATAEIMDSISRAVTGADAVNQAVGAVSREATDTGGMADQVLDASTTLVDEGRRLNDQVTTTLWAICARPERACRVIRHRTCHARVAWQVLADLPRDDRALVHYLFVCCPMDKKGLPGA